MDLGPNSEKIIMGLDVSTKTVGITIAKVTDLDKVSIIQVTHLRPKIPTKFAGTEALFMKSSIMSEEFRKYKEYGITDVVIEEPLIGSNNAETAATLLRYNGMISQSVYDILGVVPVFISSYDARKFGFPQLMAVRKFNKQGNVYDTKKIERALKKGELVLFGQYPFDCEKKLILLNMVSELFKDIQWQYDKNGDLKKENFDASDSLVCVLGYINKLKYSETEPVITQWSKDDNGKRIQYRYQTEFCGNTYDKTIEL